MCFRWIPSSFVSVFYPRLGEYLACEAQGGLNCCHHTADGIFSSPKVASRKFLFNDESSQLSMLARLSEAQRLNQSRSRSKERHPSSSDPHPTCLPPAACCMFASTDRRRLSRPRRRRPPHRAVIPAPLRVFMRLSATVLTEEFDFHEFRNTTVLNI